MKFILRYFLPDGFFFGSVHFQFLKITAINSWNQGGEFGSLDFGLVMKWVIGVLCVACFIGIIGNSIILVVLSYCKSKNPVSILLINLALANILFQMIVLPCQIAVYWLPFWSLGRTLCRLSFFTEDMASSQVAKNSHECRNKCQFRRRSSWS